MNTLNLNTIAALALVTLVTQACVEDENVPANFPARKVTPHAYVWNGASTADVEAGDSHRSNVTIFVFDGPVGCDALPPLPYWPHDFVVPGVRLGVAISLNNWMAGSTWGLKTMAFDAAGHRVPVEASTHHLLPSWVTGEWPKFDRESFELLSMPTAKGALARVYLDVRIAFHGLPNDDDGGRGFSVYEIVDAFDAEVCGDISVGSKG